MNIQNQQNIIQKYYTDNKSIQKKNATEYLEKRRERYQERNSEEEENGIRIRQQTRAEEKGRVIDTYA